MFEEVNRISSNDIREQRQVGLQDRADDDESFGFFSPTGAYITRTAAWQEAPFRGSQVPSTDMSNRSCDH